nr:hypothetical protein [Tanacetum cinerariifolium]
MGIRIPQSNVSSSVADEAITKKIHDGLGRATTTASSLEAEQGSGNISKTQTKATPSGPSSPGTSSEGGPGCHVTIGVVVFRLGLKGYLTYPMNHHSEKGRMIKEIDDDENVNMVKSSKQGEAHETARHRMESDDTQVVDFSTVSPQKDDESFLVVGIDYKVLVNSSSSGSISLILACHAPSSFLGDLSQLHRLCWSKMSFHQALNLIFEFDETAVRCTRDILRQSDFLDWLSEIPWVMLTLVVIEGESYADNLSNDILWEYVYPLSCYHKSAVRQAHLVDTDTESDLEEAPSEAKESQPLGSRVPLMSEEFEASGPLGTRTISSHSSVSSDSTSPLSADHPLTHASSTPTPTQVLFHHRTVRMAVRTQPTLSPGMSAQIVETAALSPSSFFKMYRSSYDTSSSSSSTLPTWKRYQGTFELNLRTETEDESSDLDVEREGHGLDDEGHGLDDEGHGLEDEGPGLEEEEEEEAAPEGQQHAVLVVNTATSEPLGLGYGALRCLDTDTESDLEEAPSEAKESQPLGSRVPLMSEEFEASGPLGTRTISSHSSVSSDSTSPLSADHPLTHASSTPTPTQVLFHHRTVRMAVRTQPTLSPGMSAQIVETAALSPSSFFKMYRSSYDTSSSSSSTLPTWKRYQGTFELNLRTETEDESSDLDVEREGHGLDDEGHGLDDEEEEEEEEAAPEGQQHAVLVVNTATSRQSFSFVLEQGAERISAFRQPTLTPPSSKWSSGSLPVLPSSPVVPSPIALLVATPAATISVDKDQFLEVRAQLELHGSILQDHTQLLDVLPPTLFEGYDRDLRELYTRSREYAAMQHELQEMRGCVAILEQERSCKEQYDV